MVQIFNTKVAQCESCDFYNCGFCNLTYTDCIDGEVNKDCPFTKELTQEDIESFGFEKKGENYYKQKDEKFIKFYKRLWKHAYAIEIKMDDEENYIEIEVTTKQHLKFILMSLNLT